MTTIASKFCPTCLNWHVEMCISGVFDIQPTTISSPENIHIEIGFNETTNNTDGTDEEDDNEIQSFATDETDNEVIVVETNEDGDESTYTTFDEFMRMCIYCHETIPETNDSQTERYCNAACLCDYLHSQSASFNRNN
jgi:hypothetical protein